MTSTGSKFTCTSTRAAAGPTVRSPSVYPGHDSLLFRNLRWKRCWWPAGRVELAGVSSGLRAQPVAHGCSPADTQVPALSPQKRAPASLGQQEPRQDSTSSPGPAGSYWTVPTHPAPPVTSQVPGGRRRKPRS